jgi:hypothetical protein
VLMRLTNKGVDQHIDVRKKHGPHP